MLIHEALGYTRHGLRVVSKEEADARAQFVLSRNVFKPGEAPKPKPLNSYQNKEGTRTLADLVWERHRDDQDRLDDEYRSLFRWPQCPEMRSYARRKEQKEEDYQSQREWVSMYRQNERDILHTSTNIFQHKTLAALTGIGGTLMVISGQPVMLVAGSLLYLAAVIQAFAAKSNHQATKDLTEMNREIRVVLEDWYEDDRFARHDRMKLNRQLQYLDKERPTKDRRFQKRSLVAEYRAKHPRKQNRIVPQNERNA